MKLKIKKIHEDAVIPKYVHTQDSGMDIYSIEDKMIKAGETALIKTGLIIELPENTEAQVRPKSGIALNNSVTVLNSPGTIDESFRGEICVILINHSKVDYKVEKFKKIAQIVIQPVIRVEIEEVKELSDTTRGQGGFGSTGLI